MESIVLLYVLMDYGKRLFSMIMFLVNKVEIFLYLITVMKENCGLFCWKKLGLKLMVVITILKED